VASPTVSLLGLVSTSAIRPEIFDMILGSSATPADNANVWCLQRFTAAGTNTGYVPPPLDPGDPACTAVGAITFSGEPTYTAVKILFRAALNQRATHRWIADPRGPLKFPATASNGGGLYVVNASFTGAVDGTVFFNE
jgi:hypothetical protein